MKALLPTLLTILACSCTQFNPSISQKDQDLLEKTLLRASNLDEALVENDLSVYSLQPKNLQASLVQYKQMHNINGFHDYEYLKEWAIKLLNQPMMIEDPEVMVLSIYAASIAKDKSLLPILERGIRSYHPQLQLAALYALAEYQDDDAEKLLLEGSNSYFIEVVLQTLQVLVQKKHPKAFEQIDSLYNKLPEDAKFFFPSLYASLSTPQANAKLKRFFHHSDSKTRTQAILAVGNAQKEEFLKDVQRLSKQHNLMEQEACCYSMSSFLDESSIPYLEDLLKSSCDSVKISAAVALNKLNRPGALKEVEKLALEGDCFALYALKDSQNHKEFLEHMLYSSNEQIRLNAAMALLNQKNPKCLPEIKRILISQNDDLFLSTLDSVGHSLKCYKWSYSVDTNAMHAQIYKEQMHQIKCQILESSTQLDETYFVNLAQEVVHSNQKELVPFTVELLGNLKTTNSIEILKDWQQKAGSPYLRAWSNLALFYFDHQGPWKNNVLNWIKEQKFHDLIQIKPIISWMRQNKDNHFELSPYETSDLLIQSYIAIALKQDEEGLNVLIDHLSNFDSKNRFALAGILIKATE